MEQTNQMLLSDIAIAFVEKAGLLQQWYDFKNAAESDLTKEWLIEHNLQIQNGK